MKQIESHEITQRERLLATSRNIKTRLAQIKAMPWPEFIARGAGFGAGILLDYLIFKGCGLVIRRLASLILSNTIIQKIFNDIAIGVKIGTETGPGAAKTTIDVVRRNPRVLEQPGKTAAQSLREIAGKTARDAKRVASTSRQAWKLSKIKIKHISNRHIATDFAKQVKHLSKEALEIRLKKKSFFNPNWSKEEIIQVVEEAYRSSRSKGLTGPIQYKVKGEIIEIYIEANGDFRTAYGFHRLSSNFFV